MNLSWAIRIKAQGAWVWMKCQAGVWMFGCSGVKGKSLSFCSLDGSHKSEVLHLKFAPLLQALHLPHYSTVPSFSLCSFSQDACEEATQILCRSVLQNAPGAVLSWWCSPLLWICPIQCPGEEGVGRAVSHQELPPLPMAARLAAPLPLGDTALEPPRSCTQQFCSFSRTGRCIAGMSLPLHWLTASRSTYRSCYIYTSRVRTLFLAQLKIYPLQCISCYQFLVLSSGHKRPYAVSEVCQPWDQSGGTG